jgi:hypothetical protein
MLACNQPAMYWGHLEDLVTYESYCDGCDGAHENCMAATYSRVYAIIMCVQRPL